MNEERGLICVYCGEAWGYVGQEVKEEELKAAIEHEKTCPKNPHVQEIKRLSSCVEKYKQATSLLESVCDSEIWCSGQSCQECDNQCDGWVKLAKAKAILFEV